MGFIEWPPHQNLEFFVVTEQGGDVVCPFIVEYGQAVAAAMAHWRTRHKHCNVRAGEYDRDTDRSRMVGGVRFRTQERSGYRIPRRAAEADRT